MVRTGHSTIRTAAAAALLFGISLALGAAGPAHSTPVATDMPNPEQAMRMLRNGNARFVAQMPMQLNLSPQRIAETASNGQHPFATVMTCSDSRVPVEILFDRGIGDLFVIRVAGNVSDTDEVGSIEYGVDHLGTPVMVVLGHTGCGAVTAVVEEAKLHGSIPALVDNIKPAVEWVKNNRPELEGAELINAAVEANVWQSIDDLISTSPAVASRIEQGTLRVVGAVYELHTGKVRWLGDHPYQDKILTRANRPATPRAARNRRGPKSNAARASAATGHH